jgi:hypothetical protein
MNYTVRVERLSFLERSEISVAGHGARFPVNLSA